MTATAADHWLPCRSQVYDPAPDLRQEKDDVLLMLCTVPAAQSTMPTWLVAVDVVTAAAAVIAAFAALRAIGVADKGLKQGRSQFGDQQEQSRKQFSDQQAQSREMFEEQQEQSRKQLAAELQRSMELFRANARADALRAYAADFLRFSSTLPSDTTANSAAQLGQRADGEPDGLHAGWLAKIRQFTQVVSVAEVGVPPLTITDHALRWIRVCTEQIEDEFSRTESGRLRFELPDAPAAVAGERVEFREELGSLSFAWQASPATKPLADVWQDRREWIRKDAGELLAQGSRDPALAGRVFQVMEALRFLAALGASRLRQDITHMG